MILTGGECPNWGASELNLNKRDLYECPNCRLVCAADGLLAAVMPLLGAGEFREPNIAARWVGLGVVWAQANPPLPGPRAAVLDREELDRHRSPLNHCDILEPQ